MVEKHRIAIERLLMLICLGELCDCVKVEDRGTAMLERHRIAMERLTAAGAEQPIELSESASGKLASD